MDTNNIPKCISKNDPLPIMFFKFLETLWLDNPTSNNTYFQYLRNLFQLRGINPYVLQINTRNFLQRESLVEMTCMLVGYKQISFWQFDCCDTLARINFLYNDQKSVYVNKLIKKIIESHKY